MGRTALDTIRREELVAAAVETVGREGHEAATVARIARAADMSPGLVHHYFSDKGDLLAAAYRATRKPVAAAYVRAVGAMPPGHAVPAGLRLMAAVEAHLVPSVLTPVRAAAWSGFTALTPYRADYARIRAAQRARQASALRAALSGLGVGGEEASDLAVAAALALDGLWLEAATREGGLYPGEGELLLESVLAPHYVSADPLATAQPPL
ncbi:TetR family transcriptional regulator [Marivibrio halodurans]|uniref:TetR family transcriptional regulator n=1 Tax=Marivibrio halodurans TaxID=2039722 RepID=A0A8J7S3R0_9PROT|nr:TetR family transcriptional regulator [Marivibrio halodurans]MBP5858013.1 TetR family transcriptional regulator [Marivibrio halodurans]